LSGSLGPGYVFVDPLLRYYHNAIIEVIQSKSRCVFKRLCE
jgi:hypothetical protein